MSIAELERLSPPAFDRARPKRRQSDRHASATAWLLAEASPATGPGAQRSAVEGRSADRRAAIRPLVVDEGCEVRIGGAAVTGALRLALLAWLPPARAELTVLEQGLFQETPTDALTLLLRPPTIWSLGEAVTAARLCPGGMGFEPERFELLERHGRERLACRQLARLRAAVARIDGQLPIRGYPVASATVAAGCDAVATDGVRCAAIAARQLARYASSALIARSAR